MPDRIYVASSWRNDLQPRVVQLLETSGFEVYDFRSPSNAHGAFSWSDLGIERPEDWPPERCIEFLNHPRAVEGFEQDYAAMLSCVACVLVLPAGRSANLEAGWFVGKERPLVVLKDAGHPDLMYRMASRVVANLTDIPSAVKVALRKWRSPP